MSDPHQKAKLVDGDDGEKFYATTDLGLAAYLVSKGSPLEGDRQDAGKTWLLFERTDRVKSLRREWISSPERHYLSSYYELRDFVKDDARKAQ